MELSRILASVKLNLPAGKDKKWRAKRREGGRRKKKGTRMRVGGRGGGDESFPPPSLVAVKKAVRLCDGEKKKRSKELCGIAAAKVAVFLLLE